MQARVEMEIVIPEHRDQEAWSSILTARIKSAAERSFIPKTFSGNTKLLLTQRPSSPQQHINSRPIPFSWEERPGTPNLNPRDPPKEDDFAFNFSFSAELERPQYTDELFDGGKNPPPQASPKITADERAGQRSPLLLPRSPRSSLNPISHGKKIIRRSFFHQETRRKRTGLPATRSLSPYRVSQYPWEEEQHQQPPPVKQPSVNSKPPPPPPAAAAAASSTKSSSRKWRFTDFLLFRSASEGRAADKDPLRKFSAFKKNEDTKNTSSRPTDGSGSGRRKGPVSAHELHYTKNKAASKDLNKKTFLPYKSGILGFHGLGAFSRS
ncbi:hypothetical protein CUMW_044490 [Citrus unshiu]|nr:hypothetical protein CUMW_044490 [Citrus unshiu]